MMFGMGTQAVTGDEKLSRTFSHRFDVVSAETPALREQAYRLRYQVYCKENSFEDPREHPEGMERDEFDPRSVQSLLLDRFSGTVAGTVRLILPHHGKPEASFPIYQVCPLLNSRKPPSAGKTAEVSRFAVSKEYRAEALLGPDDHRDPCAGKRVLMSCLSLGLMKGIVRMSMEHGVTDLLAVMKPALLRQLSGFGIYFAPIGQVVDYHGVRQPCQVNLGRLFERVRKDRLDVWEVITDEGMLLERAEASLAHCV